MILEDDEAVAALIKFYLEEESFHAAISLTGKAFLDKVIEYQPDLITLEVLLSDTDGFTVFRALQQEERTRDIPVIFITVEEEKKEKGLQMGASGYISKPFSEHELKGSVKSVLGETLKWTNTHVEDRREVGEMVGLTCGEEAH